MFTEFDSVGELVAVLRRNRDKGLIFDEVTLLVGDTGNWTLLTSSYVIDDQGNRYEEAGDMSVSHALDEGVPLRWVLFSDDEPLTCCLSEIFAIPALPAPKSETQGIFHT